MRKISIVIPIHDMKGGADFLWKSVQKICEQSFKDFELIIVKEGSMPCNVNAGIKRAKGELIKILFLDDILAHEFALKDIVSNFRSDTNWLITGTSTNPHPVWTDDILSGNNKLGSPSALTIRNDNPLLFDENMSWLLDCDYYYRMFQRYGRPTIYHNVAVIMGIGDHQMTHILTDEQKMKEHLYIQQKYAK